MGSSFDALHDALHDEQHPTNDEQRATHLVGTARVATGATDGLLAVALALSGDMSGAWVGGSSADIDKELTDVCSGCRPAERRCHDPSLP